ncbi:MAG: prolipoprotein diacylglyceryl transferase family protein [Syntrophales bacterium]
MSNELFIACVAAGLGILLYWGFRVLPQDKWQFLAAVPRKRLEDGSWQAVNLTYYGLFNALAHVIALSILLILTGSIGISEDKVLFIMLVMMGACLPASRLLAGWIEKKPHTFTVGGASFVGILLGPPVVWLVYRTIYPNVFLPWLPLLAALAVAYAVGEGVGRLACISFGCCYGKPIVSGRTYLNRLCQRYSFIFTGTTKKIAYEGGLGGRQVFPIQAVTATIFIGAALSGMYLFLVGAYGLSFFLTILVTQLWRFLSEMFRADYRGGGSLSAYQLMALLALSYALAIWFLLPPVTTVADIRKGVESLWQPGTMLSLQAWGVGIFWYTGNSRVIAAQVSFHVNKELT